MTKLTINIGTADKGDGDPLRVAFNKVNENFTEIYDLLGLADNSLNLGAFEFDGSIMTTTDSSSITIAQEVTVTGSLTVGGDVVPTGDLQTNLGSPTHKFHSIYVGTGSVYLGDAKLSLEGGRLSSSVGFDLAGSTNVNDALPDQTGHAYQYLRTDGEGTLSWANAGGSGGSSVVTSDTAPVGPAEGDLWYDTVSGRMYVQFDNNWIDSNPVDGEGILSTDKLTNGVHELVLNIDGDRSWVDFPAYDGGNIIVQGAGIGATTSLLSIFGSGSVLLSSNAMADGRKLWEFGTEGKLTLPAGTTYEYLSVPLTGHGDGLAVLDFALVTDGVSTQWIASSPNPEGVGYSVGDTFTFDETFLGIPGASTTIEVLTIGEGGSIVEIGFSQPPLYPADIYRDSPINLQVGAESNRWTFGATGNLTLPDGGVVNETATDIAVSLDQFTAGGFFSSQVFFKISDTLYESPAGSTMELVSDIWRLKIGPSTYYDSTDLITWSPVAGGLPAPVGTLDTIKTINLTVGDKTWGFNTRGGLTTPNGSIGHDGNGNIILASDSLKSVKLWSGNGLYSWEFDATGILTTPGDIQLGADSYLRFPDSSFQGTAFVGDASRLYGNVDEDVEVTVQHRTIITAPAMTSASRIFVADITENDDITLVGIGWSLNIDDLWVLDVTEVDDSVPGQYSITVPGADFTSGTSYSFRNPTATLHTWTFNNETGTLIAPGGAILSSESITEGLLTDRNFSIELPTEDGTNEYRWVFANGTGALTVPGVINSNGAGELNLNVDSANIIRLSTTDTYELTDLILHPTLGISLTTNRNVAVSAGAGSGSSELYNIWFGAETLWENYRNEDAQIFAPDTRPWAGMPSYEAYPVLLNYNFMGPGLPPSSNLAPAANAAKLAYEEWQAELAAINVTIDVADNDWVFGQDGSLTVPGIITKDSILQLVSSGTSTSAAFQVDGSNTRLLLRTNNGSSNNDLTFDINGTLTLPNYNPVENAPNIKIGTSTRIVDTNSGIDIPVGTPGGTVYTSSFTDLASMKLLVTIEGEEDTGDGWPHTQVCEMMVVRRDAAGLITVNSSVYGVVYTGNGPLATLTAITSTDGRVDIIAEATNEENITVKVHAIEIFRNQ